MKIPITTAEMKQQLKQNARDPNTKRNYPELDSKPWPTEEQIQQACLNDCTVKYSSYEEWWNNCSSGVSRLIRKLIIEDHIGEKITWEDYEKVYGE